MKSFSYTVKDPEGLHARPAGILAKAAAGYQSSISLIYNGKKISAKKLFSIMGLAVKCGGNVTVEIEGDDEAKAYEELEKFFRENL